MTTTMTPTTSLFQSIPEGGLRSFWDGHRLKAMAVAKFLKFSNAQVASIAGVAPTSVRFDDKMPRGMLERLTQVANIAALVTRHFDGDADRTRLWFMTPNPLLQHTAPRDMILLGHCDTLQKMVVEARNLDAAAEEPAADPADVPPLILVHQAGIAALCLRYGVRQLALVGSILKEDDGPSSMLDMMVELGPPGHYADFSRDLAQLLGRPVDLIQLGALPDCRLKRLIQRTRVPIYAAAG